MHLHLVLIFLLSGTASAIEPGTYMLEFWTGHVGIQQEVELLNFRRMQSMSGAFDIRVSTTGGLMRFPGDSISVNGLYHVDKFYPEIFEPVKDETLPGRSGSGKWIHKFEFVIPKANVLNVSSYRFIGIDKENNGVYAGVVDLLGQRKEHAKVIPSRFTLKRIAR